MTLDADTVQARAKRRLARIERGRRDPRFRRVVGRLKAAGLLQTNYEVPEHREPITIEDALWAGKLEPRILELLPALVVKRPSLFAASRDMPNYLGVAVRALRQNTTPSPFRGIPGRDLSKWLPRVGRQGKLPSRLKCFRFTVEDIAVLEELGRDLGLSETDTIRRALRALARTQDSSATHRRRGSA